MGVVAVVALPEGAVNIALPAPKFPHMVRMAEMGAEGDWEAKGAKEDRAVCAENKNAFLTKNV